MLYVELCVCPWSIHVSCSVCRNRSWSPASSVLMFRCLASSVYLFVRFPFVGRSNCRRIPFRSALLKFVMSLKVWGRETWNDNWLHLISNPGHINVNCLSIHEDEFSVWLNKYFYYFTFWHTVYLAFEYDFNPPPPE